jgi:hypothetical protein
LMSDGDTCSHHFSGRALENLDAVLPPFADAIAKYTGMVTIVTVVGPSGEEGGEIVIRR